MPSRELKSGEAQFNIALVLLFALSVLAMYVGVAAIIGAFLAGMALAESVSDRVHDLAHGITEITCSVLPCRDRLHLDVTAFADRDLLILAMVILVAAVFSKLIGCGLGAIRLGAKEMMRIGCGMVPRGEVGMVVAQLGLSMAVIEKPVYAVVVFMAVATTLRRACSAEHRLCRREAEGRRRAVPAWLTESVKIADDVSKISIRNTQLRHSRKLINGRRIGYPALHVLGVFGSTPAM